MFSKQWSIQGSISLGQCTDNSTKTWSYNYNCLIWITFCFRSAAQSQQCKTNTGGLKMEQKCSFVRQGSFEYKKNKNEMHYVRAWNCPVIFAWSVDCCALPAEPPLLKWGCLWLMLLLLFSQYSTSCLLLRLVPGPQIYRHRGENTTCSITAPLPCAFLPISDHLLFFPKGHSFSSAWHRRPLTHEQHLLFRL